MITAKQISEQLADQADRVAAYLLPAGKRQGREWCAGNTHGDAGDSLKVCMQGNKAGVWADFASGQTGDLLDLWREARGCDLSQAIKEAKAWLGIRDVHMETTARKSYAKPKRRDAWKPINTAAVEWLTNVRKLSAHTIAEFRLEFVHSGKMGNMVMLPFYRDGEIVAVKYRSFPGKEHSQEAGCEPCLFGWQCFPPDLRAVVLTEGEFDTMALHTYGVPALSVPMGGGGGEKQGWVEVEYDRLARFDQIYLALDSDKAGAEGTAELVRRLGADRCYIVKIPRGLKDFNDCLIQGVPRDEIDAAIMGAKTCDPPELRDVAHYTDEVCKIMRGGDTRGLRLPWKKAGDQLLFRPGETSIIAGRNGHGKSQLVGWLLLNFIEQGNAIACVASLEFKTAKWLVRLAKQACANGAPPEPFVRAAMQHLSGKLWSFDQTSGVDYKHMLSVFRYAARRYGCEVFVIDNLAKCGIAEDDYRAQHLFMQAVTNFSRDEDVHVIVVHHLKKSQHEADDVGKNDIKGSGSITDLADTVLTIWRNKKKEAEIKAAAQQQRDPKPEVIAKMDALLECHKQRNGDDEPSFALWFDKHSYQFLASPSHRARSVIDYSRDREEAA